MNYRDRNRKQITLPSGATAVIRKLTPRDFVLTGSIPTTLPDPRAPKQATNEDQSKAWGIAVEKVIFTKCLLPIQMDGQSFKVVDKPFGQAGENEIEIEALDQHDAEFIVAEVLDFSGLGKGASRSAQTFQANGSGHDHAGQSRAAIPATPVDVAEPVAG